MSLAENSCIPCRGGVPPVTADRAQALLKELCIFCLLRVSNFSENRTKAGFALKLMVDWG